MRLSDLLNLNFATASKQIKSRKCLSKTFYKLFIKLRDMSDYSDDFPPEDEYNGSSENDFNSSK